MTRPLSARLAVWAAVAHLLLVAALLVLFVLIGERWGWAAVLFFSPRALFALPWLAITPALVLVRRPRWLLLQGVTAVLLLGPVMGLQLSGTRATPARAALPSVRLLTWNVWFGAGDNDALARVLAEQHPDLVVFEAAAHPADVVLQRAPFEKFYYLHEDQFAVASRFPLRVADKGTLVSAPIHRPWVRFEVDSPLGTLQLFAVHPHSARGILNLRHGGLRHLLAAGPSGDPEGTLRFLDEQLRETGEAALAMGPLTVLAGDFNVPDGGALLRRRFAGLRDAFAEEGSGFGYTFPVNGRWLPWMRLDRVLLGAGLQAVHVEVPATAASDHAPLIVDLALRP